MALKSRPQVSATADVETVLSSAWTDKDAIRLFERSSQFRVKGYEKTPAGRA